MTDKESVLVFVVVFCVENASVGEIADAVVDLIVGAGK